MREDIQCLRGIAIILVFIFHLAPTVFVNGFLGVDIFFVISGFLMAKNLTQSKLMNFKDFINFYYRRFRRILPLYYFVIFVTVVMVHMYLGEFLWKNNNRYSLASLFLVTNQLVIHDQADYFDEFLVSTHSVNVFLHLWSLSVEMQFYLLVPFIFFGLQFIKNYYFKLIVVSGLTVFGFLGFSMLLEKFAFNFMFLRLWQFSAGFVALYWTKARAKELPKKEKGLDEKSLKNPITKIDLVTVCLSIMGCCLFPNKINVSILRPLVTAATAALIGCEPQNVQLLQSRTLSYIGDISYVMYLVHWPIISIFLGSTFRSYIFCILTTILSSILLHHLFEERYLKMDWKALIPFLFALILCNSYLQNSVREHSFWNSTLPEEVQSIVDKNQKLLPYSWAYEPTFDECVDDVDMGPLAKGIFGYGRCKRGYGTSSVMVLGNSYVMSFRDPIRSYFHNNFSEFRYISLSKNFGFFADSDLSRIGLELSRKHVEQYKPNVVIIIARYLESLRTPIKDNDYYLNQMNENIKFYEKFVDKIYIMDTLPLFKENFINYFLQYVINRPEELEYLHLDKQESDYQMRNAKRRFNMVKCKKCHFFDLSPVFAENGKYLTFDRDRTLAYIDNSIHISIAGIDLCRPTLEKFVKEIMNNL